MARRARIADCLYLTASGKYQTWWRDQDDKVVWTTFPTLQAAKELRDGKRTERAKHLQTPKLARDMRRMVQLLQSPKPQTDQAISAVVDFNEDPTPDDARVWKMYD